MRETTKPKMIGHVLIRDGETKEILVNTYNAINYEAMVVAMAEALTHNTAGLISEMHFGNGAANVSGTGTVTYFPPNVTGLNAQLYNDTYYVFVDANDPRDTDPTENFMTVQHLAGTLYADIIVTATLGYGQPSGQQAFDNASNTEGLYVFNEMGLKTFSQAGGTGTLLTHVIFSPIQKSLNRLIEIEYTLRIQMS